MHLRFKIKPEEKIIGQGLIQNDRGVNLRYFHLMPQEIPELLRNLLAAMQSTPKPRASTNKANHKINLELHSFVNEKKRADNLENDSTINSKKRSFLDKLFNFKNETDLASMLNGTNKTFV